jgi:hypothetical protein
LGYRGVRAEVIGSVAVVRLGVAICQGTQMDATTGRRTWRTLEAYHGAIYFLPEAAEAYEAVGVTDRMVGYFASRSAAMGAVSADVVIATFFNFDHDLVRRSMDGVWSTVSPSSMVEARYAAVDKMITTHVMSGVDPANMARAAELARIAAEAAMDRPEGRPLFAAHAGVPWPDDSHLVLWHAQTLLREFRGDGHIVALVDAGLSGCEALVTHGASGDVPSKVLRSTRARTDDDWQAAIDALQQRGWLTATGSLTEAGRTAREAIEDATDRMSLAPYSVLGVDRCAELRQLVRPWSATLANMFRT